MPNVRAFRSGNWSDANLTTSPWASGGILFPPTSADDVYSNTFTIHVDQNVTVNYISNWSTASTTWKDGGTGSAVHSGTFNLLNNVTLHTVMVNTYSLGDRSNGNDNVSTTDTLLVSGTNSATIIGNIAGGGNAGFFISSLRITSTGNVLVIGDVRGGNVAGGTSGAGIIATNGNLIIRGSLFGGIRGNGDGRNSALWLPAGSLCNATIYGNVLGYVEPCILYNGSGVLNIYGNVTGNTINYSTTTYGHGVLMGGNSVGTVNVFGNVTGGIQTGTSAHRGISTSGSAAVTIAGNIIASSVGNAFGSSNANAINKISANIIDHPNGTTAIYAPSYRIDPIPINGLIRYSNVNMFTTDSLSAFSMPPVSAVRSGVSFANNTLTGTCRVPSPSSVTANVQVDNTVGIAVTNIQSIYETLTTSLTALTGINTVGSKIRSIATTDAIGNVFASFTNG